MDRTEYDYFDRAMITLSPSMSVRKYITLFMAYYQIITHSETVFLNTKNMQKYCNVCAYTKINMHT